MTTPEAAPGPRRQGPDVGVVVEAMRALLDPAAVSRLHERRPDRLGAHLPARGWETGTPEGCLQELVADWRRFDTVALQGGNS